jgi:hypothetical protein
MSAPALDVAQYEEKKVLLTLEGSDEAVAATIVTGSPVKTIYKLKGKSNVVMIDTSTIKAIELAPEADADMKARRLNEVALDNVKRHLVDRHAYSLSQVNAMTPEDAFEFHAELDHDDLSHYHADPPAAADEN